MGGCYNNTGSTVTLNSLSVPAYAWFPNEAGKYLITATAQGECGGGNLNEGSLQIKLNGTTLKLQRMVDNDGHARNTQTLVALVALDGTDDYIQAFFKIDESGGGNFTLESYNTSQKDGTSFGGFKIIE